MWSIVFISAPPNETLAEKLPQGDHVSVFLPCTPNPTTGFWFYLPTRDVIEVPITNLIGLGQVVVSNDIPSGSVVSAIAPSATPNYFDVTIIDPDTGLAADATATATIGPDGRIKSITLTNAGSGYTSALVQITTASNDIGQQALAVAILEGQYGTLRSYYYNSKNVKTIFSTNVGTVDYTNGVITLNSFNPLDVNNDLGQLTLTASPTTTIISSSYNKKYERGFKYNEKKFLIKFQNDVMSLMKNVLF